MAVSDDQASNAHSDDDHAHFQVPKSPSHSDEFDIVRERKSVFESSRGHSSRRRQLGTSDARTHSEAASEDRRRSRASSQRRATAGTHSEPFASEGEEGRFRDDLSSEKSEPFGHQHHHHSGFHDGFSDRSLSLTNSEDGGPGDHAPENLHSALLRIHELEEWIKSMEATNAKLTSQVREAHHQRKKLSEDQHSPEALLVRIHDLEAKIRNSEAANAKLAASLNTASLRSRELEERCRPLEDTIDQLSASLDAASSRVRELEASCKGEVPEALLAKLPELEGKCRSLEKTNKELSSSYEASSARVRELEERCRPLEAAKAQLSSSCEKMTSRCEELEERGRQREAANKELSASFDLASSRVRELEERCRPLEASNAQLSASLNTASKNIRELEDRCRNIEHMLAQKEEDNRKLQAHIGAAYQQAQDAKSVSELEERSRTLQVMLTQKEDESKRLQARIVQASQQDASAMVPKVAETSLAGDSAEQFDRRGQGESTQQTTKVLYVGWQGEQREDGGESDHGSESGVTLTRREARRRQKIMRRHRGQEETQSIGEEAPQDDVPEAPEEEPTSVEPESEAPETTEASTVNASADRWHHGVGLVTRLGGAISGFFDDGSAVTVTEDMPGSRARFRRRRNREGQVAVAELKGAESCVKQDDSAVGSGDANGGQEALPVPGTQASSFAKTAPVAGYDGASIRRLQNVLGAIHNSIGAKPMPPGEEMSSPSSVPHHEPNEAKEKLEACMSQIGKGNVAIMRLTEKLNAAKQRLKEKADVMNKQRASIQAGSLSLPRTMATEIDGQRSENLEPRTVPNDAG